MWVGKNTQYGGDVVMFLPHKIIIKYLSAKQNVGKHNMGDML